MKRKNYLIFYKEITGDMPLHSSDVIGAKSITSASKKFYKKHGYLTTIQNIKEMDR